MHDQALPELRVDVFDTFWIQSSSSQSLYETRWRGLNLCSELASGISHAEHWGYALENVGTKNSFSIVFCFFFYFCYNTTDWAPPRKCSRVRALRSAGISQQVRDQCQDKDLKAPSLLQYTVCPCLFLVKTRRNC